MIEKWIAKLAQRIREFLKQAKVLRIKFNIVLIVGVYFVCVLITQLFYGLINLNYSNSSNQQRDIQTVSHYINQVALNTRLEIERIEEMSGMVYDESYFYFEEKEQPSTIQSNNSELNTIIDIIFKVNDDISGISIYRPKGGMISYTNPYSPFYYTSGTKSRYSELIKQKSRGTILMRSTGDTLGQSMVLIKFYQPVEEHEENAIVVIEKNWESYRDYFQDLGLLNNGSIVMINSDGQILMSFRNENAIGDEELVRTGQFRDQLNNTAGMLETKAYGENKYVFYDKSVSSGCTLLYIAGSDFFGEKSYSMYYIILSSSLLLIVVNILIVILFNRKVYRPITNMEGALHAIVTGDSELKVQDVQRGNELYPMYNDLNSLIVRLKQLIDSEYTAGIMKKQAEIDALQSQINPHFLYNTLESIRGQAIEEEVEGIEKMVKALADIFRYSITNKNAMVTLEEELKNIANYLNIQQFRFNNKFIVINEIEEDTKNSLIPKLAIQPLVENAILHGLETKPGKGTLRIKTTSTLDSVLITIEDDGDGIDKETLDAINECLARGINSRNECHVKIGLGLININERIKLIFDDSFGLRIFSMKHMGTKVELRIPKTIK